MLYNSDNDITKENVFLDVNKNANESNVIDMDNDINNIDCVSFNNTVKKTEMGTLVNENNQMTVYLQYQYIYRSKLLILKMLIFANHSGDI